MRINLTLLLYVMLLQPFFGGCQRGAELLPEQRKIDIRVLDTEVTAKSRAHLFTPENLLIEETFLLARGQSY